MYRHMTWSIYADPDLITTHAQYSHHHVITHYKSFIHPSGQNQHCRRSVKHPVSCWTGGWYFVEYAADSQCLLAPACCPDTSAIRLRCKLLVLLCLDVCFQLAELGGTKPVELDADVKYVLCETFGMNDPGCGFYGRGGFAVEW